MMPMLQLEVQCEDGYDCQKIPRTHFYMPLSGLVDWEFSSYGVGFLMSEYCQAYIDSWTPFIGLAILFMIMKRSGLKTLP